MEEAAGGVSGVRGEDGSVRREVVLLSGGLDSTTAAYWCRKRGCEIHALAFDYGQRHRRELAAAEAVARAVGAHAYHVVALDLRLWGGSALTSDTALPLGDPEHGDTIPPTYVPARNTILLALALSYAEAKDCRAIVFGANREDHAGYPDCRPDYFRAFREVARLGTKRGVESGQGISIERPFEECRKPQIIRRGLDMGVDYGMTWSCYAGGECACGRCDACLIRLRAFAEVGVADPLPYAT